MDCQGSVIRFSLHFGLVIGAILIVLTMVVVAIFRMMMAVTFFNMLKTLAGTPLIVFVGEVGSGQSSTGVH